MSNNSGIKAVVYNTLEQLTSSDLNLQQQYASKTQLEIARAQHITRFVRGLFYSAPIRGNSVGEDQGDLTTVDTPLRAMVLQGLGLNIGTATSTVNGGTIVCLLPDATPDADDSACVYVEAPDSSALAITPNTSGTRWDLIEVNVSVLTTATQARNIWDPATQSFSSAAISKTTEAQATYRIRTGTAASPSSGPPALAQGWLPIAAILHVGATASWDDVDVFDVRPLAAERMPQTLGGSYCHAKNLTVRVDPDQNLTSQVDITGEVVGAFDGLTNTGTGSQWTGGYHSATCRFYWSGPAGETTTPVVVPAAFGLTGDYQPIGDVFTPDRYMTFALAYPFGLPRWRRYTRTTTGAAQRYPVGQLGIPVVVTAANALGGGVSGLPSWMDTSGLHPAIYFAHTRSQGSQPELLPTIVTDEMTMWGDDGGSGTNISAAGSGGSGQYTYTLSRGATNELPLAPISELVLGLEVTYSPATNLPRPAAVWAERTVGVAVIPVMVNTIIADEGFWGPSKAGTGITVTLPVVDDLSTYEINAKFEDTNLSSTQIKVLGFRPRRYEAS